MLLFQKNIFSVTTPVFSKLADSETIALSSILKKNYPALLIKEIYQIGAFELNSNNWKIITNKGIYILKRADIKKHTTLSAQAEWTFQLTSKKFPSLQFLKSINGDLVITHEHHIYCITFFENGNYFGSALEDWLSLMTNLKKLFDYCSSNFSQSATIPERLYFTREDDLLIELLKTHTEVKGIAKTDIIQIISSYEKSKLTFQKNKNAFHTNVFHVDIHPHNLIFNNNELVLLTDFESFQMTTLEISLGFGIYKCLRQLLAATGFTEERKIKTVTLQLKAQFDQLFPEQNFKELILLGKIDILKRLLYIVKEMLEKGESKWQFIFNTQLISLEEIDMITNFFTQ